MRRAVSVVFFVHGAVFANWASRIPAFAEKLDLSESALGFTLFGLSIGVVTGLPIASWLIGRWGSRIITIAFGILQALLLTLLTAASSAVMLFAFLILFGASASIMDIAMNAQAVEAEKRAAKPIMSSFHAMFSIGGFAGAGMGAALAGLNFSVGAHFITATILAILLLILMLDSLTIIEEETQPNDAPIFTFPSLAVLPLGFVAFCAAVGEGTMADWSALYLREIAGAGPGQAALGFSIFNLTMTAGRLSGDHMTSRLGPKRIIPLGGAIAATGLALAVAVPITPVILIGFGLAGIGLATIIPVTFSLAGRLPDVPPGTGIAGVATIGYAGFLAAPPLIGIIAEAIGLQAAMGFVAAVVAALIIGGKWSNL